MTVLQIHNRYQFHGGEDVVVDSEKMLLESHGHTVIQLLEHNNKLSDEGKIKAAINTVWSASSVHKLECLLEGASIDVAHVHNTFLRVSPAIYHTLKRRKIPVVQTLHNYRFTCANALLYRSGHVCEKCLGRSLTLRPIVHACYHDSYVQSAVVASMILTHGALGTWKSNIDVYIALSESSRHIFARAGFPAERIRVKPNFVEPVPESQRQPGTYALFVGRLVEAKGVITLLEAVRELAELPIRIVGNGPLRHEIAGYRETHNLHNLEIAGELSHKEVLDQIRGAFCLVFPVEWHEPFGRIVIESLACGVPVVGSAIGAVPELVRDGETGLLFEAGRPEKLRERLRWAHEHREEMQRMGMQGRKEFEQKYTAEKNYSMLMDIYREAIERNRTMRSGQCST